MQLKLISLAITAIAIAGCNKETISSQYQRPTPHITYVKVVESPLKVQTELKGRVTAVSSAEIRPQVTGIIQSINVKDGEDVKKGQILYKVDPAQYQALYQQTLAAYDSVKADIKTAKTKAERYSTLAKEKAISMQDAEEAQSAYLKLVASLAEKKAAITTAKINLDYTDIKAPISGILGISTITPGALVTANQTDIINTITTLSPIYVDLSQPSKEFINMKILQKKLKSIDIPVELKFENNDAYSIQGKIHSNEYSVNQSTDSIKLRAIFDNKDKLLLPGMYTYANLTYGIEPNGIKIPLQSIVREPNGTSSVYIVNTENKIEKKFIKTLSNVESKAIVTDGLANGDKLVFEGIDKIKVGDTVTAEEKTGDVE